MELKTVDFQVYKEYLEGLDSVDFLQSDVHAKKLASNGWEIECIQFIDQNQIVAAGVFAYIPLMKCFKYCYVPRGFLMDYHNEKLVHKMVDLIRAHLKRKNVVYMEMDPAIILQERDKDGQVVDGGFNNLDVVENLKKSGFIQLPLMTGYDLSKECRWVSVLHLKNKTKEDIFKDFSYSTRQDVRGAEKYCVQVRELDLDELSILDNMEKDTSKRHDFEGFSLQYYLDLYASYGKEHIKTLYAYLDLPRYQNKIETEFKKTEANIQKIEAFLEEHPGNIKKEKRLKTEMEYHHSLEKKLNQIDDLKNQFGDEVPLASCLFIKYANQVIYLVGASDYEYRLFKGPYAIQWKMIQEAIDEGYDAYNFYGISGFFEKGQEGYGVFDYKRGFNAVVHEYIGNFILPCKPLVFKLYNQLKKVI